MIIENLTLLGEFTDDSGNRYCFEIPSIPVHAVRMMPKTPATVSVLEPVPESVPVPTADNICRRLRIVRKPEEVIRHREFINSVLPTDTGSAIGAPELANIYIRRFDHGGGSPAWYTKTFGNELIRLYKAGLVLRYQKPEENFFRYHKAAK